MRGGFLETAPYWAGVVSVRLGAIAEAYLISTNAKLSNELQFAELCGRKVALHACSHLMPTKP